MREEDVVAQFAKSTTCGYGGATSEHMEPDEGEFGMGSCWVSNILFQASVDVVPYVLKWSTRGT